MMYQKTEDMGDDSLVLLLEYIVVNWDNDGADRFPNHSVPPLLMDRTGLFEVVQCF